MKESKEKKEIYLTRYHVSQNIFDQNKNENISLLFNSQNGEMVAIDQQDYQKITQRKFSDMSDSTFQFLKEKKFLTNKNPIEELDIVISENEKAMNSEETLYIIIQPTEYCQLGCGYCGQSHSKKSMTDPYRVIEFIKGKIVEHHPKKLLIGWFGSEPLSGLSTLLLISSQLKKYCKNNKIDFNSKIVTNGLALTPKVAKLLEEEASCTFAEVTLDGSGPYHNQRRHLKSGAPSFDIIYNNIKEILTRDDNNFQISIRCNTDATNKEGVDELI
jgi:uncharacterized protein